MIGRDIVIISFISLVIFAAILVIRAFFDKMASDDSEGSVVHDGLIQSTKVDIDEQRSLDLARQWRDSQHNHVWRDISEFAKRCRICGEVEFSATIPDGMQEYIEELTTIQARTEPKEASFKYEKRDPRNWGAQCPTCKRVIGKPEDLPQNPHDPTSPQYRCPYCNSQIMPDWSSEKFRYLDVNSKVREYLGRESPKNHD